MEEILTKVEQIARMADLKCQRNGDLLMFGFDMGGGRSQTVAVTKFAEGEDGMNIILFFSPCQEISKGVFAGGLSKGSATTLLRHNASLPFGHFAIMEIDDQEMVCVRTTQILETMEVEEFQGHCYGVANVADAWEKQLGVDKF
ncbi:MAG: hypothetical protein ACR2NU_16875 [Aeoliella sp.]